MPDRSQYALFVLAVTFTWLMGLMGFARSGIRQHWHVWEVLRDTSPQAFTPALGYAANMISLCVLIFLSLVAFIFWLGGLAERAAHRPALEPRGVAVPLNVGVTRPGTAPVTGD
jgi:cytochrome d ubiquinol oxidase subunit I